MVNLLLCPLLYPAWWMAGQLCRWFAKIIPFTIPFNHKVCYLWPTVYRQTVWWLALRLFLSVPRNVARWKTFMLILESVSTITQKKVSKLKNILIQGKALSKHCPLNDSHMYAKSWFILPSDFIQLHTYHHSSTDV